MNLPSDIDRIAFLDETLCRTSEKLASSTSAAGCVSQRPHPLTHTFLETNLLTRDFARSAQ
jgi:hypothetical protein